MKFCNLLNISGLKLQCAWLRQSIILLESLVSAMSLQTLLLYFCCSSCFLLMLICGQHLKVRQLADPALCCCCGDSKVARLQKGSRKGFSVSTSINCQPSCPFCIRTGEQCACVPVKHQLTTYCMNYGRKQYFQKGHLTLNMCCCEKSLEINLKHYFKGRARTIHCNSLGCLILNVISGFNFAFLSITHYVAYPKLNISIHFNAFQMQLLPLDVAR